jgi:hypothetical protein
MGMSVFLTVALLLNSRHHLGVLQRLGSINASMCSCDVKINRFWAVCIWGRAVRLRRNRVSWLGRYLEAWRGFDSNPPCLLGGRSLACQQWKAV